MSTHRILIDPNLVHGAVELPSDGAAVVPARLPAWALARAEDPQLSMAAHQPSGVRLVVDTTAQRLALEARAVRSGIVGAPMRPPGLFDVLVDGELVERVSLATATTRMTDLTTGSVTTTAAEPELLTLAALPPGEKRVEIWLPHTEQVELFALHADAPVRPVVDERPRWLHHGSSISQGSNAQAPSTTWLARSARALDLNLTNLGFGGSAMADSFTARAMAAQPADLISIALGINIVNADLMRRRALRSAVHGFLDTVRDAHPGVPIALLTPPWCPAFEQTPGPGAFDPQALARGEVRFIATGDPAAVAGGALALATVRDELTEVVAHREDPSLTLVDGLSLYGPADEAEHPLPDGLHPDDATHALIAERFVATDWAGAARH